MTATLIFYNCSTSDICLLSIFDSLLCAKAAVLALSIEILSYSILNPKSKIQVLWSSCILELF